jgi:hypothetical protein
MIHSALLFRKACHTSRAVFKRQKTNAPFAVTHVCPKSGDIEGEDGNCVSANAYVEEGLTTAMRTYDVYRGQEVTACVRIRECGQIEWAYRQEPFDWQGFWWSNDDKLLIEELIQDFPHRETLTVSEFTIRRHDKEENIIR